MEEDNEIFLAVDNALGYLAGSLDTKYPMTFIWGHSLSTCGSYDQFCDPTSPLVCTSAHLKYPRRLRI